MGNWGTGDGCFYSILPYSAFQDFKMLERV